MSVQEARREEDEMWWMFDEGQTAFRILLVIEAMWVVLVFALAAVQSRAHGRPVPQPVRMPTDGRSTDRRAA